MSLPSIQTLFEQATEHHRAGQFREAEQVYRRILEVDPTHAEAAHRLGIIAFQFGNNHVAMQLVQYAIAQSTTPEYYNTLGEIHRVQRHLIEAEASYRRAIELNPRMGSFYSNLCLILRDQRRLGEAVSAGEAAIQFEPNLSAAHLNLANALSDSGDTQRAIDHYQQAARIDPNDSRIPTGLGATLMELGQFDEALKCFDRATAIDDSADAHHNRSFIWLVRQEFDRGWDEFEWRWRKCDAQSLGSLTNRPAWDGSNVAGKTILLFAEQGLGDAIQFIRYVPMVARRSGAKIILLCRESLKGLFEQIEGISQIVTDEKVIPEFDYFLPLLSLPRVFRTTERDIPANTPYLHANASLVEQWKKRMGEGAAKRVGLVWQGRPTHVNDRNRSIPLKHFSPFAAFSNIRWISLQKGHGAEQAQQPPLGMEVSDFMDQVQNFSDTAAIIANLDLVIGVDTSVIHLAGAMGRPAWVLVPYSPDWRWMLDRSDSPWYPTMRLLRQPKVGDWSDVIAEAAQMLKRMS